MHGGGGCPARQFHIWVGMGLRGEGGDRLRGWGEVGGDRLRLRVFIGVESVIVCSG